MRSFRSRNPVKLFDGTTVGTEVNVVSVRDGDVTRPLESVRDRTRRESRRTLRGKVDEVSVLAVSRRVVLPASDPLRVIVQNASRCVRPTARSVIPLDALVPIARGSHRVSVASRATLRRIETGRSALTRVVRRRSDRTPGVTRTVVRAGTHVIRRANALVRRSEVVLSRADAMARGRIASTVSRARVHVGSVTPNVAAVLRIVRRKASGAVVRGILDEGGRTIASAVLETNSAATVSVNETRVASHGALGNSILSSESLSLGIVDVFAEVTVIHRGKSIFRDGMRSVSIDEDEASMVVEPLLRRMDGVIVGGRRSIRGVSIEEERTSFPGDRMEGFPIGDIDNFPSVEVDLDQVVVRRLEEDKKSRGFWIDSDAATPSNRPEVSQRNFVFCRIRRDESVFREWIGVVRIANVHSPEIVRAVLEIVKVRRIVGDVVYENSIARIRGNLQSIDSLESSERVLVKEGGRSWSGVDVASFGVERNLLAPNFVILRNGSE